MLPIASEVHFTHLYGKGFFGKENVSAGGIDGTHRGPSFSNFWVTDKLRKVTEDFTGNRIEKCRPKSEQFFFCNPLISLGHSL